MAATPASDDRYTRRVVDEEVDALFGSLAALSIEGAKAVGKTATASRRARTVHRLDDEAERRVIEADRARLLEGRRPVLIDEWQRVPAAWDIVRRAVDEPGTAPGSFLLTGSATPAPDVTTHSGAGRIVTVRMRPMTLVERGVATATVSLAELLGGRRPKLGGDSELRLRDYADEILASGFPGLRALSDRALRAQLDGYLDRITERDFPELGVTIRNPAALRRWLAAYAAASSTTASYETIRDAATGGQGEKPSRSTVAPYRDALERLWIVDPLPAWSPTRNRLRRLASPPKHQLVDPALAARLLGVGVGALLHEEEAPVTPRVPRDGTLLGALFESLVTLDVRVFAQAAEARVGHLRTAGGEHEVDLIVERDDGRVLAVEVKLTANVDDRDVRHLVWLRERLGAEVVDAIVITTGVAAYRRPDGIGVVPAGLLGP
jgi:predicted AAA+ superfamily ATPase